MAGSGRGAGARTGCARGRTAPSSAVRWPRINNVYARLRRTLDGYDMGRITGPEPEEERERATARRLILATPTVDIGYNFVKLGKTRQHIDFVVCDARYGDELLQRIGTGWPGVGPSRRQTVPSHAVAVLPPEAAAALAAL